ncbi:MAG: molybdenum ABC transporter ATP-binding protein [Gammaproteobacteria bacterium]|nr:MAG: molybdenum ABC transporter ATP-binding protein [Gammaproteobacteria bacterium]
MTLAVRLQHSIENPNTTPFELDVQTHFPSHRISALFGPSGAGKTTLLRCIAGLEKFPHCEISCHRETWQNRSHFTPTYLRRTGFVFQNSRLFPHLCVKGNLDYGISRRYSSDTGSQRQATATSTTNTAQANPIPIDRDLACEWFGLNDLLNKYPQQLSAGETQRVALARAILNNPLWLLMDEPIANLDEASKELILQRLKTINEQFGLSMLFVSHDLEDATQIASHLTLMKQGKITTSGTIEEVLNDLNSGISSQQMGSIIEGKVELHDTENKLTSIRFHGGELSLQQITCPSDTAIKVRIPARDVSINLEHAQHSSVLNILSAEVVSIQEHGPSNVLVKLKVGDQFILSNITKKSLHRLDLAPNKKVFAQIKSVSLVSHPNLYQHSL